MEESRIKYLQQKYFSKFKKNLYGRYLLRFGLEKRKLLSLSEEKIQELIQRRGLLFFAKKFLETCGISVSPKIFLFSFLVRVYPIYVDNDKVLIFLSEKISDGIQSPINANSEKLKQYLLSFNFFLTKYKEKDYDITLRNLSLEIINLEKGLKLVSSIDFPDKEAYLQFNLSHRKKIREECERVYHIKIDEYIFSDEELREELEKAKNINLEKIIEKEYLSLSEKIKTTVKKIYWDNLSSEIKEENYSSLENLLIEIKAALLSFFGGRSIEIEDVIDISRLLSSGKKEDISKMFKYIFLLLSEVRMEMRDETFLIFNIIDEIIAIESDYSKLLPAVLCLLTERLEKYEILK